jgi:hypothetical protein
VSTRASPVKVDFTPFRLIVVTGISTGNPGSRGFGRKPTFENEGPISSGKSSARLFTTLVGMPSSVGIGKMKEKVLAAEQQIRAGLRGRSVFRKNETLWVETRKVPVACGPRGVEFHGGLKRTCVSGTRKCQ